MNVFASLPSRLQLAATLAVTLAALGGGLGCSKEIGDSCFINSDCDINGLRICDNAANGGYCTILGCDYDTCPDESVCVRFYAGVFENRPCDPATEDAVEDGTDDCSLDEVCTLTGKCAVRTTEVRYCMRRCGDSGDCRDDYECRDEELMIANGGEPLPAPEQSIDPDGHKFCAEAP